MPLHIVRNDITKMNVDAIVNAANESLLGGGGVDGAIHRAAGPRLLEECRTLHGCKTGDAKITKGYDLPAKYVIHTVGPIYRDGQHGEKELLESCYRKSLQIAKEHELESIAFPMISAGVYGYPKHEAFQTAVDIISKFLLENEMQVYIVVFGRDMVTISKKLFADIAEFIGDAYAEERAEPYRRPEKNFPMADLAPSASMPAPSEKKRKGLSGLFRKEQKETSAAGAGVMAEIGLEEWLGDPDESWQQMLLRCIDEEGLTDPECYKRANIDRKLFSKIRKDEHYKPSKPTAIAFAIALKLPKRKIDEMLKKAGYALSGSDRFDLIISYFISRGEYDIYRINDALFAFDQSLLGNVQI